MDMDISDDQQDIARGRNMESTMLRARAMSCWSSEMSMSMPFHRLISTLELGVNHVAAASDVLLVVGNVHVHALPSAHLNLGTVRHGGDARAEEGLRRDGALRRGVRLDAASRLRDRGHRARVS